MESLKEIVVIYHADCADGFGAAYAAWKKFGESASYIPSKTQTPPVGGLRDKELYILDYSYSKDVLEQLVADNKKVVVIDHHGSAQAAVESFPDNIFDLDHSGAVLAWQYFHPNAPTPELLQQVEDHDLWRFVVPDNQEFNAALRQIPRDFTTWEALIQDLSDEHYRDTFLKQGALLLQFENQLIERLLQFKERVRFEGHEVFAINASRIYRSVLGNKLAEENKRLGKTPLGIVYYRYDGAVHISLRSKDDVDVAAIAVKYGGGGHKHAASLRAASLAELPFEFIS